MGGGSTYYNRQAMLRLVNRSYPLADEYRSKCNAFKGDIDEALRWVHQYCVLPSTIFAREYEELNVFEQKKEFPNPITDQLELIIRDYGWPALRQGLVDLANRKLELFRFIGLDTDKWTKTLAKFESLYHRIET